MGIEQNETYALLHNRDTLSEIHHGHQAGRNLLSVQLPEHPIRDSSWAPDQTKLTAYSMTAVQDQRLIMGTGQDKTYNLFHYHDTLSEIQHGHRTGRHVPAIQHAIRDSSWALDRATLTVYSTRDQKLIMGTGQDKTYSLLITQSGTYDGYRTGRNLLSVPLPRHAIRDSS